ncbi:hypothetical protein JVW19_20310, partial [Vibrio cholerae O1]|nr:hypothetical protein [Vibrio cholerae O1]
MEYDSNENVWNALCYLPITLERISCSVVWDEKIFVYGTAEGNVKVCYIYEPPPLRSAAGKQAETIGMWTAI